jgi:uncharacterized protein
MVRLADGAGGAQIGVTMTGVNRQAALEDGRGVLSDPVHDYVRFSAIERRVLSHRAVQRLRYIGQNGLAHLVFPEVRTSRFIHSVGAMHLASPFFAWSIANADEHTRARLLSALCALVDDAAAGELGALTLDDKRDEFFDRDTLHSPSLLAGRVSDDSLAGLALVEQALRLAALFHDLGHLPFSHDFEHALELWHRRDPDHASEWVGPAIERSRAKNGAPIHEHVGEGIVESMLAAFRNDRAMTQLEEMLFIIVKRILNASTTYLTRDPKDAALTWLHRLVAGEVDVDRCDYILRDGRSHGLDFVGFDLRRLTEHLTVLENGDGVGGDQFEVAVDAHGVSALESMLVSRYRLYQYGIRHHKVAQVGIALQHCISGVLTEFGNGKLDAPDDHDLREFLSSVRDLAERKITPLDAFCRFDDAWMAGILRRQAESQPDDPWLALICWRASVEGKSIESLWKRTFPPEAGEIAAWNEDMAKSMSGTRWTECLEDLAATGTLIVGHSFAPFKLRAGHPTQALLCVIDRQSTGEPQPINERSPVVDALARAWRQDIQLQVFTIDPSMDRQKVLGKLRKVMPDGTKHEDPDAGPVA